MARAREIFDQTRIVVVTERFHAARSAFLARNFGIRPIVFCADDLSRGWNVRSSVRETAARPLALLDVFVFHRGPKFLGEKVPMVVSR